MIEIYLSMSQTPDPIVELLEAVRELYAGIERFDALSAAKLGVDRSGLRAINAMERGSISPGALGELLGLSSGSVTALLDRLETGGHIERQKSDGDGRRRDARLKNTTREAAHLQYSLLGETISDAFGKLGPDQFRQSMFAIRELAKCFERAQAEGFAEPHGSVDPS
jgi:DNA-binding MarR family transcriptional regulator